MNNDKMILSSFDDWLKNQRENIEKAKEKNKQNFESYFNWLESFLVRREKFHKDFPFVVCVEAFEPILSFASRWCWQNFGPYDGGCHCYYEIYPACPKVLETEYIDRGSYKDKDGIEHPWEEKKYKNPGEHSHEGSWMGICMGKKGYDYFVFEYCFKNESDKNKFLENVENFNIGENYET